MTDEEKRLLKLAQHLCATQLEPLAEEVDLSGRVPRANLDALAAVGLMGVTTPRVFGGSETGEEFRRAYVEALCGACGTTYFVLIQHLGSCTQLAQSSNPVLRERFLRAMAAGKHYVGVGFGHLRRPQPMLRATPVSGGWELTGVAPWVTGWPVLAGTIYGAHLPDGRHIYLYADATESDQQHVSEPLGLCAMGATETVEVTLDRLFVPDDHFVRFSSPEQLAAGDAINAAGNVAPMFGVATASVRALRQLAERRPLAAIPEAAVALEAETNACRSRCFSLADETDKNRTGWKDDALAARAWAIELGVRAAHTVVAAASGAANNLTHPAQRRLREAMFYTLFQQSSDILQATVRRLARLSPPME